MIDPTRDPLGWLAQDATQSGASRVRIDSIAPGPHQLRARFPRLCWRDEWATKVQKVGFDAVLVGDFVVTVEFPRTFRPAGR